MKRSAFVLACFDFVRTKLQGEGDLGSDVWNHTRRVLNLSENLAEEEATAGAILDFEVIQLAAIFHDVARPLEEFAMSHGHKSAQMAQEFLNQQGYSKTSEVAGIIRQHRITGGEAPDTLEGKIIHDADRLDAIGAVGVMRCFLDGSKGGQTIREIARDYQERLPLLCEDMQTEAGGRRAQSRQEYMLEFFRRLDRETAAEL